jgi:hypothetical protein
MSSSSSSSSSSSAKQQRQHGGEIVTIQCGTIANWIGTQYHLLQVRDTRPLEVRTAGWLRGRALTVPPRALCCAALRVRCAQNSNCDVNTPYQRHTHFRRSGGHSGAPGPWTPRVVSLDASVGLDGVVATYGAQEDAGAARAQERAMQQYKLDKQQEASSSGGAAAAAGKSGGRPKHWSDLSKVSTATLRAHRAQRAESSMSALDTRSSLLLLCASRCAPVGSTY